MVGPAARGVPAGWHPDPAHRAPLRYWDGTAWTGWVSDGGLPRSEVMAAHRTAPASLTAGDDRARFVADVLVPEAVRRGYLVPAQGASLTGLAAELAGRRAGPTPRSTATISGPSPVEPRDRGGGPVALPGPGGSAPAGASPAWRAQARPGPAPAAAPTPPRAASWWRRVVDRLGSEMAVHGLTYLGVLLLFVGLFGLVAFAFGDVAPAVRPLAELGSVLVPFVAARVLLRQGAAVVGRAMAGLGGLLLPLMLVTSLVDGFGYDAPRAVAPALLAAACLLAAAAQGAWGRRRPDSGVRYALAPTLWLAAAMATIAVGRPMPTGQDVAVPSGPQVVAMAWAVALTALVARRSPGPPAPGRSTSGAWAGAAAAAVLPGSVVVLALGSATGAAAGWPLLLVVPVLLALALAWDRSVPPLAGPVADVLVTSAVLLAALRLLVGSPQPLGRPAAPVGAVLLLLVVADVVGRRARSRVAVPLALAGVGLGSLGAVLALATDPRLVGAGGWGACVAGGVAVWALTRRRARPGAGLAAVAAGGQALVVLAVGADLGAWLALPAAAALLVLVSWPARRAPTDPFWLWWWRALVVAVALGASSAALEVLDGGRTSPWELPVALGLLLVSLLVGPLSATVRVGGATLVGWATWLAATDCAGVPWGWRGAVVAAGGLALAAVAHRAGPPGATWVADDAGRQRVVALALWAHLTVLLALALGRGPSLVLACAAFTAVWSLTGLGVDRGTGPWRALTAPLGAAAAPAVWTVALLAAPVTLAVGLDRCGVLAWTDPWRAAPLLLVALLYLIATRVEVPAGAGLVLVPVAVGLGGAALALSGGLAPAALALGLLVAAPLLPPARPVFTVWLAWAVLPAFGWTAVGALHLDAWWAAALPLTVLAGLALGGGAAAGALLSDGRRPVRRRLPLRGAGWSGATAALVTGLMHLTMGAALALAAAGVLPHGRSAVLVGVAAVLVGAVGMLAALPPVVAVAVTLAWVAAQLVDGQVFGPWVQLAICVVLLLGAHAVSRRVARGGWARPDAWLASAAVPAYLVGVTAALLDAVRSGAPAALIVAGLVLVVTAVRLRRRRVLAESIGGVGTFVVVIGTGVAGAGWAALTLAAASAAHTILAAVVERGAARWLRQGVGAVLALLAWAAVLDWWWPSAVRSVDASLGVAAAVLVVLAILAVTEGLSGSWTVVWGGAAGVLALAALVAVGPGGVPPSLLQAIALVVAALAVTLLGPWGADVAALLLLLAVQLAFAALGVRHGAAAALLLAASAATAGLEVALAAHRPGRRATTVLAGGLLVLGAGHAAWAGQLPLAAGVLAALAVQLAAAGVAWRQLGLRLASPVLAWAAWAVLVAAGLGGAGPAWFTAPLGLALLLVVALWRQDLRRRGRRPDPSPVGSLELAGIALLVVASFVAAFTDGVQHALVVALVGAGAGVWGLLTQVRRRLFAGAVIVALGLVVAVALPLVRVLPAWGGAGVWLAVAVVGLLVVGAATLVEKGRLAARTARARVGAWTAGWE